MPLKKSKSKGQVSPQRATHAPAMTLRALRESFGKTQGEVARGASMTQPQLSRVEQRQDHLVSTLRRYMRALGGEVDVIARVDDRCVILRNV